MCGFFINKPVTKKRLESYSSDRLGSVTAAAIKATKKRTRDIMRVYVQLACQARGVDGAWLSVHHAEDALIRWLSAYEVENGEGFWFLYITIEL